MSDPWMKFYPSDWRADPALRLCTRAARGLWIDMLSIMHEAKPRGELRIGQVALDADKLARAIGEPADEVKTDLKELEAAGVFSRRKNGVIYSRRMVRDEAKRQKMRVNGMKGGNPKTTTVYNTPGYVYLMRRSADGHVKIGCSVDPRKRIYKVRPQFPGQQVDLLAQAAVDDMGRAELALHEEFSEEKSGEWFDLPPKTVADLTARFLSGKPVLPRGQPKTTEARSHKPETPYSPPRDKGAYSDRFEAWWKSYPRKLNASKKRASTAFERLPEAAKLQAESALSAFRRSVAKTEEQYIPHPSTWLNERRFETVSADGGDEASADVWVARLAHWASRGAWSEKWGPDPNSPDCKAPADLIRQAQERAA